MQIINITNKKSYAIKHSFFMKKVKKYLKKIIEYCKIKLDFVDIR